MLRYDYNENHGTNTIGIFNSIDVGQQLHMKKTRIFRSDHKYKDLLTDKQVAVLGYGNQGRAQALNLRDNGVHVIVGNRDDSYHEVARKDGFETVTIPEAVSRADCILILIPDEILPDVYKLQIQPNLQQGAIISFASGYTIAFNLIEVPNSVDVIMIAPRMIGVGVRERFLSGEGFFCLVAVHQDATGAAEERLLALTDGVGGLIKPAIEVTFKQEVVLDLFNEQAFGPAFGRVLLTAISVLIENGIPPEAALVEMYMSEEMAYTYHKMAQIGLVKQTLYHSHTSQYGAMSRGIRFLDLDFKSRMQRILREIESGSFATEWQNPLTRLKFKVIRYFAMRQWINKLEAGVREALGLPEVFQLEYDDQTEIDQLLENPEIKAQIESFMDRSEF